LIERDPMHYVIIGGTQLCVSRLAFGTASLHHLISARERSNLLHTALECGITHFDSSPFYGFGLAEVDLGAFSTCRREAVSIATKVGLYPRGWYAKHSFDVLLRKGIGKIFRAISKPQVEWSVRSADKSLSLSLARLRSDYVDILYLHEPDASLINLDEFRRWGERVVSAGKVRYLGLAGPPQPFSEWLNLTDSFGSIIQAQDSFPNSEADLVLRSGRTLQFTYGYIRSHGGAQNVDNALNTVGRALVRNSTGSVLVSTRKAVRVKELTGLFS